MKSTLGFACVLEFRAWPMRYERSFWETGLPSSRNIFAVVVLKRALVKRFVSAYLVEVWCFLDLIFAQGNSDLALIWIDRFDNSSGNHSFLTKDPKAGINNQP